MTLALTLLAASCAIAAAWTTFSGGDAAAYRHHKKSAQAIKARERRELELEAALQADYDDRDKRMILGLVPNVYKDMEPRRALQKELKELQDSKVPEQWDEATETRFLRRRRWAAVLAILSVVFGFLAYLSGQNDQETKSSASLDITSDRSVSLPARPPGQQWELRTGTELFKLSRSKQQMGTHEISRSYL